MLISYSMHVEESPGPDTVLNAGWTTMRASARGTGELLLKKAKDFAVFSQANQLIMRIPVQYASQGELSYLILEMVMNNDEIPDKLVTSAHLPLGLTVNSLNKKQTTFEAIEKHQKLLQESCVPSSIKKRTRSFKAQGSVNRRSFHPKANEEERRQKKETGDAYI